jgi:hypothetical protein
LYNILHYQTHVSDVLIARGYGHGVVSSGDDFFISSLMSGFVGIAWIIIPTDGVESVILMAESLWGQESRA